MFSSPRNDAASIAGVLVGPLGLAESIKNMNRTGFFITTDPTPSETRPLRSDMATFFLVVSTSTNSFSGATNPSFQAFVALNGSRLTKCGVLMTIYGGIVGVAGFCCNIRMASKSVDSYQAMRLPKYSEESGRIHWRPA